MDGVSLLAAFGAGMLSFLSPCLLPLVPGYLSFISGTTIGEFREPAAGAPVGAGDPALPRLSRRRTLIRSLFFVVGFSLVFVLLGASASALGGLLMARFSLLSKISGVIVMLFGLHMMGLLKLAWLDRDRRMQARPRPTTAAGAMVVGVTFAFGWTPCFGPILAAILAVSAEQETVMQGVRLLAIYSLGLAIPFILAALTLNQFYATASRVRRHFHAIQITSGALMVGLGVLILTNRVTVVARYLSPYLPGV